jgi:hypothetical protein
VENLCKNTARVVRPFFLGALRETRGVEKKTGGWEEQSSLSYMKIKLGPIIYSILNISQFFQLLIY